jgi:hypothetical protein
MNINDRINTYLKAILRWLNETNLNIVLVENSGYKFEELQEELEKHKDRFEIICFNEKEVDGAQYLATDTSKGASEIFAIQYAGINSVLVKKSNFIIKITGRYFIPDFEGYLKEFNLDNYNGLTQFCKDRCEIVGSHIKNFRNIFNERLCIGTPSDIAYEEYYSHVESVYKYRFSLYDNNTILTCKNFTIEPTQMGGANNIYDNI